MKFPGGSGRQGSRQFNAKNGAAFLAIVTVNFSAVLLDDTEADAEAEAGALADRLGGVERIKDAVRLLDAGAVVGEKNDDVGTIAHGFDGKDTVVFGGQGIDGVADDIEKYLHELIAVAANAGQHGFKLKIDAGGAGAKIEGAKLNGVGDDSVDVEQSALRGDLAGKTK